MKKLIMLGMVTSSMLLNLNAESLNTNKVMVSMGLKSEHLESFDYSSVYPKKFYQKSYFGLAVTGATIVGAGAFTYFTAGAGAPAAATGVSTVATWAGGGGAGSYMAGLSTVGGWFGGNAILGASILNGVSLGTVGGGVGNATFASLSILGKIGLYSAITASSLDGVFYWMNPETNQLEYKVKVSIPQKLGSKRTRELVDEITVINEKFNEAVENKDAINQKHLAILKEENNRYSLELLESYLNQNENNQEDLLVLGMIAWNNGKYDLFSKVINKIDRTKLKNTSLLNYLEALDNLSKGNIEGAKEKLKNSMDENKFAIEPIILYINILANENFDNNEDKIISKVNRIEKDFDSDKYATEYSLVSVYYRLGTIYFNNKRYAEAKNYYEKANDKLNIVQTYFSKSLKHTIQLTIANSLYQESKIEEADKIYNQLMKDVKEEQEQEMIKAQYSGNK